MLSQRALRSMRPSSIGLRPFSSTVQALSQSKPPTPSLADIKPNNVTEFNARQKAFREQLAEQKRQQEASALSSILSSSQSSPSSSSPSPTTSNNTPPETAQLAAAEAAAHEPPRKAGPLTNLIYGTKEGRELDAQLEASFSQVLARGKYVHSITFDQVKPECVDEYVALVGEHYPRWAKDEEMKVNLVGSWRGEVGDLDTFVHIWEYQRYTGLHTSLHHLRSSPTYPSFHRRLTPLLSSRHTSLMQEFSFWPTTPPRQLGGIFELRSYTLHPGNLLEWETHWRRGLKARREVMEGVGAWFVQIGELNTVHHLWQFADLEERRRQREESWAIKGWAETVHKTVPLIQTMKSRILVPMSWSPVA